MRAWLMKRWERRESEYEIVPLRGKIQEKEKRVNQDLERVTGNENDEAGNITSSTHSHILKKNVLYQ